MNAFLFVIGVVEVIFGIVTNNVPVVIAGALQVAVFGPPESTEAMK